MRDLSVLRVLFHATPASLFPFWQRNRGKRYLPDTSSTVTNTETHMRPAKKVKVDGASLCKYTFKLMYNL